MMKTTPWLWAVLTFMSFPALSQESWLMDNAFESPLYIAHAQRYDGKNHDAQLTYAFMQGRHNQDSAPAKTKYDTKGWRRGVIAAARIADAPAMAGLVFLDANIQVDSDHSEALDDGALSSRGRTTTDDLELSPFLAFAPDPLWRFSLTVASHDYRVDSNQLYVQGDSVLNMTSPTYKRSYKQVVPAVVYGDNVLRWVAQYEPKVSIRDDYGEIMVPAAARLGVLWAATSQLRADLALRHLRYSEFYTTDRNQVELTLGTRWLFATHHALSGYLAYAPDYARSDASLNINNIASQKAALIYEHEQDGWGTWGLKCQAEQGSGWTELSDNMRTRITYRARRYEASVDTTLRF